MFPETSASELSALADTRLSFAGYTFDDRGPVFLIDCWTPICVKRRVWRPLGDAFTITRVKRRHCTGWYDVLTSKSGPCPHKSRLAEGMTSDQCPQCVEKTGFNPFFYNVVRTEITPQQLRYNQMPHVVYLAYFGHAVVKAGISNVGRVRVRLLEQGAWAACIFMEVEDAWSARSLEVQLCALPDVVETVRAAKKRTLLATASASDDCQTILEGVANRLAVRMGLSPSMKALDLRERYGAFDAALGAGDASANQPFVVSGVAQALIGPNLVTANAKHSVLFGLNDLVTYGIRVSTDVEPVEARSFQRELF